VSSATIRNDMAALEDEGYLMQPHTSAGRIPTDKGYRLFVDRIAQVKPLSAAEKRAIATFLGGALDVDDVVARTVRLLAQVTQQVAIVQYPQVSTAVLRSVDIVRLHDTRGLILVVSSSGRISQGSLEIPPGTTDDDLAELRARLAAVVIGLNASRAVKASPASPTSSPCGIAPWRWQPRRSCSIRGR
jgi:heat-inducible transcriptional repressor